MKKILFIATLLFVAGCTTPMTTLRHPKSQQVVTCGGSATGSMVGGVVGYHIQKSNDTDCVTNFEKQGFAVIDKTPE
jgi:hypothetical protein